jgi:hypothetical protein
MSGGGWDGLVAEAKARLTEQEAEESEAGAELGESVDLEVDEAFTGRYRGRGKAFTKRGDVDVHLVWNTDNERRFFWPKTRLEQGFEEESPGVGDRVVVVRGQDIPTSNPEHSPTQRYVVRAERCDDPLPEKPAATVAHDDIPF